MKKIFYLVSLAVLALTVGCSEDQTSDASNPQQGILRASTEASTRTALDGTKVVWTTGDKLAVLTSDAPATIEQYTLSSEAGLATGDFTGNPLTGQGEVCAFYPYNAAITFTESTFNFTLPATQAFTAGSFANNTFPMVSKSASANEMGFRNLMGVLMFQISDDQTVASLTVTTKGEKIAGAASVAMDYTDTPVLVMDASGTTSITLTNVNITLTAAPTAFYIALPAGEYAAGLKFELKDASDAVIYSITTSKPLTINRSMVAPLAPIYTADFPDAAFRSYLVEHGFVLTADGKDIDRTNMTNITKFSSITEIDCSGRSITSLKGIEYFTALTKLYSYSNQLTMLDMSKNLMLKDLNCYDNQLKTLDVSKNTQLTTLSCEYNTLTELDVSQNIKLNYLDCGINQLKTLDVTANPLTELYCEVNQLTALDLSKNTALGILYCSSNQLTALDLSKNTELEILDCSSNRMTELDIYARTRIARLICGNQISGSVQQTLTLWCNQAQLDNKDLCTGYNNTNINKKIKELHFPDAAFLRYLSHIHGFVLTADESDIDMTNETNQGKFPTITEIECGAKGIASLKGIEYFTALTMLDCSNNELKTLDVSANTLLTTFYCRSNQLQTLDVTANTKLQFFDCSSNQLKTLDVTGNPLISLFCSGNDLIELDVSKNTKLGTLSCGGNQLTALDLSKNTKLGSLYCNYNQLTALDLSKNTGLVRLECDNNQLTALDLSKHTGLLVLFCHNNRMATLYIDLNKGLARVECGAQKSADGLEQQTLTVWYSQAQSEKPSIFSVENNENITKKIKVIFFPDDNFRAYLVQQGFVLTALGTDIDINNDTNISKFATITTINCVGREITSFKGIEHFTALQIFNCSNNQVKTLDIRKNTKLTELNCSNNKMETIDLSQNILLTRLNCSKNWLEALNVWYNAALTDLECDNNGFKDLTLTRNTKLTTLTCERNNMTELDITINTLIEKLWCGNQRAPQTMVPRTLILWCNQAQLKNKDLGTGDTNNKNVNKQLRN